MEVIQACASIVESYKRKLESWKSLRKGGSLLTKDAL
jgi:hypothetical protein